MDKKTTSMKFHEYLEAQIDICGRSQKDIAADIGYERPNIITMFKQGRTKVPITKVAPLANAIGVDPVKLLEKAMSEYMPEAWDAIQAITGYAVTKNEIEMINIIRQNSPVDDPHLATADQKKALVKFAKSLTV